MSELVKNLGVNRTPNRCNHPCCTGYYRRCNQHYPYRRFGSYHPWLRRSHCYQSRRMSNTHKLQKIKKGSLLIIETIPF